MKKGRLEIITGCMSCGKTEELIRRMKRAKIARQKVIVFKPKTDSRSLECLESRSGQKMEAIEISSSKELIKKSKGYQIIGIDEAQFLPRLTKTVNKLIDQGKRIIISALDTDFRGEPFGEIPDLIAISDSHLLLTAVCVKCGSLNAVRTQRIIDGAPAHYDSPLIMVGGEELYEARCRDCHEVPGRPD